MPSIHLSQSAVLTCNAPTCEVSTCKVSTCEASTGKAPTTANPTKTAAPTITANTALFLDFDGTLVDIAPHYDLIEISPDLRLLLAQLFIQLNGAVAIVSGRSLLDLDAYLAPLKLPLAAEHGAVCRFADGQLAGVQSPALQDVIRVASALAAQHPGLQVEIKTRAVALHYRQAPDLQALCLQAMAEAVLRTPGVELLHGKFVLEAKPAGITKGTAIQALMQQLPFTGRVPVFAGDDITDEAGFLAVQSLGGDTIKVGAGDSQARYRFANPFIFRHWLSSCAKELQA